MRGQGALEYLLILAAVLAIAAIVIFVVTSLGTSTRADTMRKACTQSMESCKLLKVGVGASAANTTACAETCSTCAALDKYLVDTGAQAAGYNVNNNTCVSVSPL